MKIDIMEEKGLGRLFFRIGAKHHNGTIQREHFFVMLSRDWSKVIDDEIIIAFERLEKRTQYHCWQDQSVVEITYRVENRTAIEIAGSIVGQVLIYCAKNRGYDGRAV